MRPPIFESYSSTMPPAGEDALPISKPAVFAFIASLMQCLPILASLIAIGLGIFGLVQVRRKQAIGKPLAIAAIVIGAITIVLWSAVAASIAVVGVRMSSVEETARGFVEALAEGDMQRALALASEDVSSDQLAEWHLEIAGEDESPQVMTWNFSLEEQDEFDLIHLWNGPYRVEGQIRYQARDGQSTAMRTAVTVVRDEEGMKVQNLIVRPSQAVIPNPQEIIRNLSDLEDFEKLKELEKMAEEMKRLDRQPSTRPGRLPPRPRDSNE